VLSAIEPRFATVEPERAPVELTIARVELTIDPVRARAIALIDAPVPALDSRVCTVHAGLSVIEPTLQAVVVRRGGRSAGHEPDNDCGNEGGLPRGHAASFRAGITFRPSSAGLVEF
jgi:hypothetical protein